MTRAEIAMWSVTLIGGATAWTLFTLHVAGWLT